MRSEDQTTQTAGKQSLAGPEETAALISLSVGARRGMMDQISSTSGSIHDEGRVHFILLCYFMDKSI